MFSLLSFARKSCKSAYFWSFLFILSITLSGVIISNDFSHTPYYVSPEKIESPAEWSFGGPRENSEGNSILHQTGALASLVDSSDSHDFFSNHNVFMSSDASLVGVSSPLSIISSERNGIKKYKIQKGDTLSEIASKFGISLETLRWANPKVRTLIQPGQELTILPVSGILYKVTESDSLESVASHYKINSDLIKKYNPDYQKLFDTPDNQVVLPYARPLKYSYRSRYAKNLPDMKYYFALPARGWNWGSLHYDNAVDIADKCGSPIYSSAEGLVVEESGDGYWNQGYGNYVLIEHPNGTRTKYAHVEKSLVKVGDYVAQGDKIALIGNSGKTHGPTGCHLHFEVRGARNPFAIR